MFNTKCETFGGSIFKSTSHQRNIISNELGNNTNLYILEITFLLNSIKNDNPPPKKKIVSIVYRTFIYNYTLYVNSPLPCFEIDCKFLYVHIYSFCASYAGNIFSKESSAKSCFSRAFVSHKHDADRSV